MEIKINEVMFHNDGELKFFEIWGTIEERKVYIDMYKIMGVSEWDLDIIVNSNEESEKIEEMDFTGLDREERVKEIDRVYEEVSDLQERIENNKEEIIQQIKKDKRVRLRVF